MLSKKIVLPILTVAILGGITLSNISAAKAQAETNDNPLSNLVQIIAQKFGLDQAKVQTVVDEYRQEKRTKMQATAQQREEERLAQLVKNGKISEDQKKAVLAKLAELRNKYKSDNFQNMTPEQRKEQSEKMREEINAWAKEQKIDLSYLTFGSGMGMKRGHFKNGINKQ